MEWERDIEWGIQELDSVAASSQSHHVTYRDAEGTGADSLPCAQQAQQALASVFSHLHQLDCSAFAPSDSIQMRPA